MKPLDNPEGLMYSILQEKDRVDRISIRLNNGHKVFSDVSLDMPKLAPAELGLLRAVSYFYVLYFEAGKVNIDFLSDRFQAYQLASQQYLDKHPILVNRLRTYFQHNLDPSKPRDRDIQYSCENWFREKCGASEPYEESQWETCLSGFLNEINNFFQTLTLCLRQIEKDESRDQILQQWNTRRSRYHPPHEFDNIISRVAADMGRENLDSIAFRKRFYDKWSQELKMLHGSYNFETEARKLIEHSLLHETERVLPITGKDILSEFVDVEPGPRVGELLSLASQIYTSSPCSKEDLLQKLRDAIGISDV